MTKTKKPKEETPEEREARLNEVERHLREDPIVSMTPMPRQRPRVVLGGSPSLIREAVTTALERGGLGDLVEEYLRRATDTKNLLAVSLEYADLEVQEWEGKQR